MTLQEWRIAVALTQTAWAELCHVSKTTVSAWEQGASAPNLRHVRALAAALHISIAEVQTACGPPAARRLFLNEDRKEVLPGDSARRTP